ncbi:MAG: mandelate racemase/muconate lactonizing enzyme family protein [Gemmatimonadetes bacterium]|nr:mandelate racemase/muconate lactonizing enzyme family protein [Gemmatimonadota bacterium]
MRITEVITHRLACPVPRPFRACRTDWIRERTATIVEVRTDEGLTGWGEGDGTQARETADSLLIGKSPFDREEIWDSLTACGRDIPAACGIEIALWDLAGKAEGKPVCELLGSTLRDRVSAYASGFFQPQGEDHLRRVAEEARRCRDRFAAVKVRIGFGPEQDERIVEAVRNAVGSEARLAVDATQGYDLPAAIEGGNRLAPYDLLWFEEPLPAEDLDGYRELRQALPIPVAGAEGRSGLASFREVVESGAMDIIQPDIGRAGGFTEGMRICWLAGANRVHVIPHMFGSVVRLAATLQWLAAVPEDPRWELPPVLELDVTGNGLLTGLSPTRFEVEDGFVRIPGRPGLGVEIDAGALRRFTVP